MKVDAVPMPDGRVLLAIAGVCGKGMQAALVASSLHTLVRATVDGGSPPADLMERLNRHLCRYLPDHVFVTMPCVAVEAQSGEMEVVSAGHPSAVVADPYGRVSSIDIGHNVGPWVPLQDTGAASFAGASNTSFTGQAWTNDISHGDVIRAGYDQSLTIDPCDLRFLYQGFDPAVDTSDYNAIPRRIGLLTRVP
jgi:hypothetical protein